MGSTWRNRAPDDGPYVDACRSASSDGENDDAERLGAGVGAAKNRDACFEQRADAPRRESALDRVQLDVAGAVVTVASVALEGTPLGESWETPVQRGLARNRAAQITAEALGEPWMG